MPNGNFVAYYRVSTERQGRSGLGLEAQKEAVHKFLNGGDWRLSAEIVEIESGKRSDNRPKLKEALRLCRLQGATLVIAKLDRLARNVAFVSGLKEAGIDFVAVDFPDANRLTVNILAAVAEHETEMVSARTKAALQAAKARGVKLGGDRGNLPAVAARGSQASIVARKRLVAKRASDLAPVLAELQASGVVTLHALASALNDRRIPAARGGAWSAVQVKRVLGHCT